MEASCVTRNAFDEKKWRKSALYDTPMTKIDHSLFRYKLDPSVTVAPFGVVKILRRRRVGDAPATAHSRNALVLQGIVTLIRTCDRAGGSLAEAMTKIDYSGYRFAPEIIQHGIWLYFRFTLSFRDVEDLLAKRGIVVSYETIRRWVNRFGPMVAADLCKRRPKPHATWHWTRSI
jgi:hypothetical protein